MKSFLWSEHRQKPEVVNRKSWMGITPLIYDSRLTIYDHRWVKKPDRESGKGNFSVWTKYV